MKKENLMPFILTAVMSVFLAVASLVFPPALAFLILPLGIFAFRHRELEALLLTGAIGVLMAFLLDYPTGIAYILLALTVILFVVSQIKKRTIPWKVIFIHTGLVLMVMALYGFLLHFISDGKIWSEMSALFQNIVQMQMDVLRESGITNLEEVNIEFALRALMNQVQVLLPAILTMAAGGFALSHYYFLTTILKKKGYAIIKSQRFPRFTLPQNFVIGAVFVIVASYILGVLGFEQVEPLQLNLWVIFSFFFAVQGIAVADFLLYRRMGTGMRWILIIMITVLLRGYFLWLLLGIFEIPFQIRARYERYVNKENS